MISNNVVCATSKCSDQPARTRSLMRAFASRFLYSMRVQLLTEHHLEILSLTRGCTGSSESTLDEMPHPESLKFLLLTFLFFLFFVCLFLLLLFLIFLVD